MKFKIGLIFLFVIFTLNVKATPLLKANKEEIDPDKYRIVNIDNVESYKVDLKLDKDFDIFFGNVEIIFQITNATKEITLNAVALKGLEEVENFELSSLQSEQSKLTITDIKTSETYETITIHTDTEILANSILNLKIKDFNGTLANDMKGFYKSVYEDKNKQNHTIATTQFQSIYARRAFPCFDEPSYKAKFNFTITYPKDYVCLFNTEEYPNQNTTVDEVYNKKIFTPTPIMATYLVAFVISDFESNKATFGEKPFNVWSRKDAIETTKHATEEAVKIIGALEKFTNETYELSKMDQVAIPDFSAGAMENWGLATYRETALLWDEKESTNKYKQRVTTVIAHEFSHMWFGDLVTLDWWSNTWLNEGFASYFEYHITGRVHVDWEMDNQFVINQHQQIMLDDALINAKPLSSKEEEVYNITQINDKFSTITYNKGASVIRMLEHIVGSKNYEKALQNYLKDKKYQNTNTGELLKHFNFEDVNLPADIEDIMHDWIFEAGYPVLHVTVDEYNVTITQEQFLYVKPNKAQKELAKKWYVPISYTTSDELNFDETSPKIWIEPTNELIKIDDVLSENVTYLLLNVKETGYYRVNYDDKLYDAILEQLLSDHKKIDVINRAQLIDDAMNLARAGIIKYDKALSLTEYLKNETDYFPWATAFANFNYLRMRFGNSGSASSLITEKLRELTNALNDAVSFDEVASNHVDSLKQELTMQWACELENEKCIEMSKKKFALYRDNNTHIPPEFRSIVYCSALRHDDGEHNNFHLLRKKLGESKLATETITLITALGCTTDEILLQSYLLESVNNDSIIRPQDASYVFNAVLTGNSDGVRIALEFLIGNWKDIRYRYGGMNALSGIITSVANRVTESDDQEKFKSFIKKTGNELGDASEQANASLEQMEANMKWKHENEQAIENYLKPTDDDNGGHIFSATLFVLLGSYVLTNVF